MFRIAIPRFGRRAAAAASSPAKRTRRKLQSNGAMANQMQYLQRHLDEFTDAIEVSTAHKLDVLRHIVPLRSKRDLRLAVPSTSQNGSSLHLLSDVASFRNESQFHKSLVSLMARRARTIDNARVMQVQNSVREFVMPCQTCAAHSVQHSFRINGSLGDIHVVAEGSSRSSSTSTNLHPSPATPQTSPPTSLPSSTAVIVEVKNCDALSTNMLSQALLQLELHSNLVCCHGREHLPEDDALTPAALLKKPMTNCPCVSCDDVVVVLWGTQSCAITSRNQITRVRNVRKEEQVLAWVKEIHSIAVSEGNSTPSLPVSREPKLAVNADAAMSLPSPRHFDILKHVRPLPSVHLPMRCVDGTVLGSVSWEVLSLHPSISLFDDFDGQLRRESVPLRAAPIHRHRIVRKGASTVKPQSKDDVVVNAPQRGHPKRRKL